MVSLVSFLLTACSTTSKLPEGEVLYTGVKNIDVTSVDSVDSSIRDAVSLALEVAPNSSLLGSAYHMSPLPFGLWIYNALYTEKEKGLKHWLWNKFKSDPTLVSQVNPALRCRAAEVAMEEEGYFGGVVTHDTIYDEKNHRKAKISYDVKYPHRYVLSSVKFMRSRNPNIDSIINHTLDKSKLKVGDRFSTSNLESEIDRIVTVLRDSGYFFYNANDIKYIADSTLKTNSIALRIFVDAEADNKEIRPCKIDSINYSLDYGYNFKKQNHESIDMMSIDYNSVLGMKPMILRQQFPFRKGALYNPEIVTLVKAKINRLNTFKYTQTSFTVLNESDTTSLMFDVTSTYNTPWSGTLEANAIYKDNHQVGPGISFIAQKCNVFKGGELFQGEFTAAYEWMTGNRSIGSTGGIFNSYEFGYKLSMAIPRLQLPRIIRPDFNNPVSTKYSISTDVMRRAGFFNLLKATGEISYTFYTSKVSSHTFTPIKLTYSSLMQTTAKFDSVVSENRVLKQSFTDQFIPQIGYTYLYDNTTANADKSSQQYFQLSVSEAGGILDALLGKFGKHKKQGERQLLGQPFSQFVKATVDFRNYLTLKERVVLATRFLGGIVYSYGNSKVSPYSEQFYIGGANSLRGYSIRSVGPGLYKSSSNKYSYMDQTGDIKLEVNAELRFPISGDLCGALFADAGNIWTARNDESRVGGQFGKGNFSKQIATDCGFGFRYDLGMLVVRFDIGVPLHDPSENNNKYYNPSGSFLGNLGYHLAVGYPF